MWRAEAPISVRLDSLTAWPWTSVVAPLSLCSLTYRVGGMAAPSHWSTGRMTEQRWLPPLPNLSLTQCRHLGHWLSQIRAFCLLEEETKAKGVAVGSFFSLTMHDTLVIPRVTSSCQQHWARGAPVQDSATHSLLQQQQCLNRSSLSGPLSQIPAVQLTSFVT